MSDDFAICKHCGMENSLVNIQAIHQRAFTKTENELIESYLFCLNCKRVQLGKETQYHHIEYGGDPDGQ